MIEMKVDKKRAAIPKTILKRATTVAIKTTWAGLTPILAHGPFKNWTSSMPSNPNLVTIGSSLESN